MSFTSMLTFGLLDPGGDSNEGVKARHREERRQRAIQAGTTQVNKAYAGYDNSFYDAYKQKYLKFAMPELAKQYQDTKDQMTYGLTNRGLLGGSAARGALSKLNRSMLGNQQVVADTAIDQASRLRQQVEGQRGTALGQLYQSQDPASTANVLATQAQNFTAPSTFAPLTNMFSDIAQYYTMSQLLNQIRPTTYVQPSRPTSFVAPIPGNK